MQPGVEKERSNMSAVRLAGAGVLLVAGLTSASTAQVLYQQWPHQNQGTASAGAPGQFPEVRVADEFFLAQPATIGGVRWVGFTTEPKQIAGFLVELRRDDPSDIPAGEVLLSAALPLDAVDPVPLDPNGNAQNVQYTLRLRRSTLPRGPTTSPSVRSPSHPDRRLALESLGDDLELPELDRDDDLHRVRADQPRRPDVPDPGAGGRGRPVCQRPGAAGGRHAVQHGRHLHGRPGAHSRAVLGRRPGAPGRVVSIHGTLRRARADEHVRRQLRHRAGGL